MLQSPSDLSQLPAHASLLDRLTRLEGYLLHDPNSLLLLADAFETALQTRQWIRAERFLLCARAQEPESLAWRLRESDWLLAQSRFDEARMMLVALQPIGAMHPELAAAVLHNLAFIEFSQAHYAQSVTLLQDHMAHHSQNDSISLMATAPNMRYKAVDKCGNAVGKLCAMQRYNENMWKTACIHNFYRAMQLDQ